jgi:uncharacterized membrane protein YeiH
VPPGALTLTLDLAGVFVFALAGALAAVRKGLDVVGVITLGIVSSIGGGLLRDALLDAGPPAALLDWRYLAVPSAAAATAFVFHPALSRLQRTVRILDAAGLGLFAVSGTTVALEAGLGGGSACLLGVLTGVGGGVIRDVLLREIPLVLRDGQFYALAALAGCLVVVVADLLDARGPVVAFSAAGLVFLLRLVALRWRWTVPAPRGIGEP